MAKKKSPIAIIQVVSLLDQMQKRITKVSDRVENIEFRIPDLNSGDHITTTAETKELRAKIDTVTTNAARGFVEQNKALKDNATGTTYALESLKTSTQRALDGVSSDIKAASDCAQRHNARISKLEGNAEKAALDFVAERCQQIAFNTRLAKLEAKATPLTETSSLETELRALLQRYGYSVNAVTVAKTTYAPIAAHSIISGYPGLGMQNSGTSQAGSILRGSSEGIEIKVNGTKAL